MRRARKPSLLPRMSAKLVWTPAARAGVKKIYTDIAREQPQAAERYFQRFREKATLLIDQPVSVSATPKSVPQPACSSSLPM
ncbi:type II toxin-antitoxin system RelE/ParE family toxin [Rhizobium leguminosarum]|uniref:type II toxin-antitoxin system RelE/ParE family toxin n=1 Tax=Rhizobium leguminosarum TaxID=384 RepID=UPI001D76603C|nr:plasmid stabilization system protein ParE [Rhizobium leguminosarum]